MQKVQNYILGNWKAGEGEENVVFDASTGEEIGFASALGLDFEEILHYGRTIGNPLLRKMTFRERGLMLKKLAFYLLERKEKFYEISYKTGATRTDSWIDIEGGIGNLFSYASLRRKLPDDIVYIDGDPVDLSRGGPFMGHHIMVPREGVAIHINAYNFPVWGMLEKCAVNWLAGMPAVVKPAPETSYLTEAVVRDIIHSNILPEGSLQLICGNAFELINYAESQDVVTFTGSATTGRLLKSKPNVIEKAIPFNMEADSLNSIVLGEDVEVGTPEFDLFLKEIRKELTVKCGQKCTAIRRIFVPNNLIEEVQNALQQMLVKIIPGDPRMEGVRMGAMVSTNQVKEVLARLEDLKKGTELIIGNVDDFEIIGGSKEKGAFLPPVLLRNDEPYKHLQAHEIEAFGPVSTLMPYQTIEEAAALTKLGKGSLCCTLVTTDNKKARKFTLSAATHHGRILILNRESAKKSTGHGSPLPLLVHGGPGRAGGGEEMGGLRGIKHYMQRCAIQGSPTTLTSITNQYQYGGEFLNPGKHLFEKHFEELRIGETVITHKRTVTEADIVQFANVSWDHFYAHTDITSLEDTTFEQRVAHGYFVLSAAAGLFVSPAKGPVLLNYGLEECRFTKPVYAGMTIGVKLTVKEKMNQEDKEGEIPKGIVKFLVDVYDETGETVAIATILTMIKKLAKEI
jgi:oxepin-CoA hydrolase/3-oxo-5,6-dehydrosuberyl-CoA semialdehyde dehydrogenase